jgi:hypothetical protein
VRFSPMSLYKRVGADAASESTIESNLIEMRERGILPQDTPGNRDLFDHVHPEHGLHRRLPRGWEKIARMFRLTEWFDIESVDGMVTALLRGWPVVATQFVL